jgi:adenylate cyclase
VRAGQASVRRLQAFLSADGGQQSGEQLASALIVVLTAVLVATNLVGAGAVLAVIYLVLPLPQLSNAAHIELVNGLVAAAYIVIAVLLGPLAGRRRLSEVGDWLRSERPADASIRRQVVRAPLLLFEVNLALWLVAAVLFAVLNLAFSAMLSAIVAPAIAITGITTGACAYLLAERILRTPASRALADEDPGRVAVPGVATRAVLAWAFGTAAPVLGLVIVGIAALAGAPASATQLKVVIVVLGAIAVVVGLLAVSLAARATADPIDNVRGALEQIQRGDFDTRVPVYDGTQIGRLQLGFNRMAEGLGERERIRDTFGSYVDPAVAERILDEGVELTGEEVEVTIMFIDIRGFTAFAEETDAREVVAGINSLFEAAIPIIHDHEGRVDKFVGDGLLAVFGAPQRLDDHADRGLAAALAIAQAVDDGEAGELQIGIGVNSGTVIAGNVGGAGRLEFSVIGDPVNVAARVQEATRETGDTVLLTDHTRALLTEEPVSLLERSRVELRGRSAPVVVYAPQPPEESTTSKG